MRARRIRLVAVACKAAVLGHTGFESLRTYQPTTPIASWGKRRPTGLWFRVAQVRVLTRQHSVLERITPRSDKGLVSYPFKAEERVRVPHGVQLSGSSVGRERRSDTAEAGGSIPPRTTTTVSWGIGSVGRAPALQAGGQGVDSPIFHSHNTSGGVAEG